VGQVQSRFSPHFQCEIIKTFRAFALLRCYAVKVGIWLHPFRGYWYQSRLQGSSRSTDVSEEPITTIFKGHALFLNCFALKDGPGMLLETSATSCKHTPRSNAKDQKSEFSLVVFSWLRQAKLLSTYGQPTS
jgi:hypothetical protein